MSADNGIYILKNSDGFRVAHAQAIENIDYHEEFEGVDVGLLYEVVLFQKSKRHDSLEDACKEAQAIYQDMSKEGYPIEYGVCEIDRTDRAFSNIPDAQERLSRYWRRNG